MEISSGGNVTAKMKKNQINKKDAKLISLRLASFLYCFYIFTYSSISKDLDISTAFSIDSSLIR